MANVRLSQLKTCFCGSVSVVIVYAVFTVPAPWVSWLGDSGASFVVHGKADVVAFAVADARFFQIKSGGRSAKDASDVSSGRSVYQRGVR